MSGIVGGSLRDRMKPCPRRRERSELDLFACELLGPTIVIGKAVCERCCRQWSEDPPAETNLTSELRRLQERHGQRPLEAVTSDPSVERFNKPCIYRGNTPTNLGQVCCGFLYTFECELGMFEGKPTAGQCGACEKYE